MYSAHAHMQRQEAGACEELKTSHLSDIYSGLLLLFRRTVGRDNTHGRRAIERASRETGSFG